MGSKYELQSEFITMSVPAMNYRLGKFLLEVRTKVASKLLAVLLTAEKFERG